MGRYCKDLPNKCFQLAPLNDSIATVPFAPDPQFAQLCPDTPLATTQRHKKNYRDLHAACPANVFVARLGIGNQRAGLRLTMLALRSCQRLRDQGLSTRLLATGRRALSAEVHQPSSLTCGDAPLDKIHMQGMRFFGYHGVLPEVRASALRSIHDGMWHVAACAVASIWQHRRRPFELTGAATGAEVCCVSDSCRGLAEGRRDRRSTAHRQLR